MGYSTEGIYPTILTERATADLPQSGASNQYALFTITGNVEILLLRGEVTTAIELQDCDLAIESNPTVGSGDTVADDVDISDDAVGVLYTVSGVFGASLFKSDTGAIEGQTSPFTLAAGTLDLLTSADNTGKVKWTVLWKPVSIGATLVAA